jgi:hypothetical protein
MIKIDNGYDEEAGMENHITEKLNTKSILEIDKKK